MQNRSWELSWDSLVLQSLPKVFPGPPKVSQKSSQELPRAPKWPPDIKFIWNGSHFWALRDQDPPHRPPEGNFFEDFSIFRHFFYDFGYSLASFFWLLAWFIDGPKVARSKGRRWFAVGVLNNIIILFFTMCICSEGIPAAARGGTVIHPITSIGLGRVLHMIRSSIYAKKALDFMKQQK